MSAFVQNRNTDWRISLVYCMVEFADGLYHTSINCHNVFSNNYGNEFILWLRIEDG